MLRLASSDPARSPNRRSAVSIWNIQLSIHSATSCCRPNIISEVEYSVFGRGGNGGALTTACFVEGAGSALIISTSLSSSFVVAGVSLSLIVEGVWDPDAIGPSVEEDRLGTNTNSSLSLLIVSTRIVSSCPELPVCLRPGPLDRFPSTEEALDGEAGFEEDLGTGSGLSLNELLGTGSSTSVASVLCDESVPPRSGSSSSSSFEVTRASFASSRDGVTDGASLFSRCQNRLDN